MLQNYKIVTLTHKQAPLSELGQLMVQYDSEQELREALQALKSAFGMDGLLYLSTCNRVTFLIDLPGHVSPDFLERFCKQVNPQLEASQCATLMAKLVFLEGEEALRHLFEVAASIDSMVIGEREILRQLREAYDRCTNWNLTGDNIRLAMKTTVEAAKEVYVTTKGAVAALTRALALDRLASYSEGFDAIITCTGHTQSWIDSELYTQLLRGGEEQKLVIDLAVPNNLTEATRAQFPIHYIDVEHLRSIARENLAFREREVTQARKLLTTQLYDFHSTYQHRSIIRAMHRVPEAIKAVKSHAMNEVFAKELRDLNPESRQLLERMMDYMERRCISIPMQAAKEVAQ